MRQKFKATGNGHSPTATLKTIQRHRVKAGKDTLRGINAPDAIQQELFSALGIRTPPNHWRCATNATSIPNGRLRLNSTIDVNQRGFMSDRKLLEMPTRGTRPRYRERARSTS
jgi:hypothetical protein